MGIRIEPEIRIQKGNGYAAAEEEYEADLTSFLEQKLAEGTSIYCLPCATGCCRTPTS